MSIMSDRRATLQLPASDIFMNCMLANDPLLLQNCCLCIDYNITSHWPVPSAGSSFDFCLPPALSAVARWCSHCFSPLDRTPQFFCTMGFWDVTGFNSRDTCNVIDFSFVAAFSSGGRVPSIGNLKRAWFIHAMPPMSQSHLPFCGSALTSLMYALHTTAYL